MAKVVYKFNPYTFARISAMKSLLLKKEDYDRIMKMDPSEITKFLQDGVYSTEINEFAIKYSGLKLMEHSLNKHMLNIFSKLKVISDPNIRLLMNQYLKRYDFWNLKTIMRGKLTKVSDEEILDMLLPLGSLKKEHLQKILTKTTIRDILESSKLIDVNEFKEAIDNYENKNDLSMVENILDYHYYLDSVRFAENIPQQGKLFQEFFMHEFDIYNIKLLLKKVYFGFDKDEVQKYVIYQGKFLNARIIKSLLNKEKLSELVRELSKTPYSKIITKLDEVQDPLLRYEVLLERFLLEKSILLFHQHPLTVDLVLGYMFAKDIEIRNLRTIIKSKTLEFTEDYVKNLIVVR